MADKKRKYNLTFALVLGLISVICFGLMFSGQFFLIFDYLPDEAIYAVFGRPSSDEILNVPLDAPSVQLLLPREGNYRVITTDPVKQQHLSIHDLATGKEIEKNITGVALMQEYDSNTLKGRILFEFEIPQAGGYELQVHTLDVNKVDFSVTIFLEKSVSHRQSLTFIGIVAVLLILVFYYFFRFSVKNSKQQGNKNKWEQFIKE